MELLISYAQIGVCFALPISIGWCCALLLTDPTIPLRTESSNTANNRDSIVIVQNPGAIIGAILATPGSVEPTPQLLNALLFYRNPLFGDNSSSSGTSRSGGSRSTRRKNRKFKYNQIGGETKMTLEHLKTIFKAVNTELKLPFENLIAKDYANPKIMNTLFQKVYNIVKYQFIKLGLNSNV